MKTNKLFSISEFHCLLDGEDKGEHVGAVGIPHSAYKSLLFYLHDETDKGDYQNFLKLTTYKRQPALKVQNYVGVLQTPCGTQIEILPKLYNKNSAGVSTEIVRNQLLIMLRALRYSPFKYAGSANIRDVKMPLLEIYISQFLNLVSRLVKLGVRSDYIAVQKNAKYLKGRLLIGNQIRKNTFHQERFYIEYQEYQINRPANRLIKSTLDLVDRLTCQSRNKRLSRELGFVFREVPNSLDIKQDFQRVKTDRTMGYYKEVLAWCKMLLHSKGPTSSAGDFNTLSLLYPMERIFEDYVSSCLRKNVSETFIGATSLTTQARKYFLVQSHNNKPIFNLRPDILIQKNKDTVCVLDTKWKIINSQDRPNKYGISQSDMYQLYAYGHKYLKGQGSKRLMLIYPMSESFTKPLLPFEYEDGFILEVVPFDIVGGKLLNDI